MFKKISAILFGATLAMLSGLSFAGDVMSKTVAEVYAEKAQLSGQRIEISGEVVKVNNGIMGKNFLHLRDGTGAEGTNDITITSQQTAKVGDKVRVNALVTVGRDFGMGYSYDLILEEAKIEPAK